MALGSSMDLDVTRTSDGSAGLSHMTTSGNTSLMIKKKNCPNISYFHNAFKFVLGTQMFAITSHLREVIILHHYYVHKYFFIDFY